MTRKGIFIAMIAAMAMVSPTMAQGEGNNLNIELRTSIGDSGFATHDRFLMPSSQLGIQLESRSGFGPIIAAGIAPVNAPQPSENFGAEMGVIGLPSNATVVHNAFTGSEGLDANGVLELYFATPSILPTNFKFFVQGVTYTPQGWAISNTIALNPMPQAAPGVFADDCASAAAGAGLDNSADGMSFMVDTTQFTDTTDTSGSDGSFDTQFGVEAVAAGNGSGAGSGAAPDVFVKFTAMADGSYTFDSCGSGFDTRMYALTPDCTIPQTTLIYNDDDDNGICGGLQSSLVLDLDAGDCIVICLDGFGLASGMGVLNVSAPGAMMMDPPDCTNLSYCSRPLDADSLISFDNLAPTSDTINVSALGGPGTVGGVSVDVDISHTFIGDMEIDVTSPDATTVRLRDQTGGGMTDLVGNFPADFAVDGPGALADFDGGTASGAWTIDIADVFGLDDGTLNSWSINICDSDNLFDSCVVENNQDPAANNCWCLNGNQSEHAVQCIDINIPHDVVLTRIGMALDVSHDFGGELVVELTAPDGTTVLLQDGMGGGAGDLNAVYPDIAGLPGLDALGTWKVTLTDPPGPFDGILYSVCLSID